MLKSKKQLIIIVLYLLVTFILSICCDDIYINIVNPVFWSILLIYIIWNKKKIFDDFYNDSSCFIYIVIVSIIQLILYMCMGLVFGFSKSPYKHDILSIIKNSIIQIIPSIGIELWRGAIVYKNKDNKLLLIIITIVSILLEVNYKAIINLSSNKEELFQYICSVILPLIPCHILCTYLSVKRSCLLSIIYRSLNEFTILLVPILPDIDWFITGSTCILLPTIIGIIFHYCFVKVKGKKDMSSKISYGITIILLIILICFMVGMFPYEPIAILSNSMAPTLYRGDVVIYKKVNIEELENIQVGMIIVYQVNNQNIVHRVEKVVKENNNIYYQTKGDSNNVSDPELVQINQIKGIDVFNIPYLGIPSVWLYEYFHK